MNEVDPELLNHHNYKMLMKYVIEHDNCEYMFWNLVQNEKRRIENSNFNNKFKFTLSSVYRFMSKKNDKSKDVRKNYTDVKKQLNL